MEKSASASESKPIWNSGELGYYENINMHYYAVKLCALHAGFTEDDAQLLGMCCNFLGSNTAVIEESFEEIPAILKHEKFFKRRLVEVFVDKAVIRIKPTNIAMEDYFKVNEVSAVLQRELIIPYHFFPPGVLKYDAPENYMCKINDTFVDKMLANLREKHKEDRENLPALAVGLHLLADLVCHEGLCGKISFINNFKRLNAQYTTPDYERLNKYIPEDIEQYQRLGFSRLWRFPHLGNTTHYGDGFMNELSEKTDNFDKYRNKDSGVLYPEIIERQLDYILRGASNRELLKESFKKRYDERLSELLVYKKIDDKTKLTELDAAWSKTFKEAEQGFKYDYDTFLDRLKKSDSYFQLVEALELVYDMCYGAVV